MVVLMVRSFVLVSVVLVLGVAGIRLRWWLIFSLFFAVIGGLAVFGVGGGLAVFVGGATVCVFVLALFALLVVML